MPDPNLPVIGKNVLNSDKDIFDKVLQKAPNREPFVSQPMSQIPLNRYNYVFHGADNEEMYARAQSGWDQLANGTIKAVGTFTSSFLTGTVGLINGLVEMRKTGRAASFYDNEFTRSLDEWNKSLEDSLPNYYTQAEKDAAWYSPTNIFTGNFWGDKVFKNLGYSAGAIVGGIGWGAVLKGVGLTSRLVAAGKGLQAVEATEAAMINAPKLTRLGAINNSLTSAWNGAKGMLGRGLMNTDRALISAFATTGEASIEALEASNNYRNKLIAEYKDTYGVPPTKEALEEINSYVDKVGNNVFAANVALLTVTNYIQLPKILGSSKSLEKGAINNINKELVEETVEVAGKKVTRQVEKYVAGTPTTGNILSPIFNKLGKPGRFIDKYVLGPGRLTVSAVEAFEEGAQFSIQAGTEDYFDRAYKHEGDVDELLDGVGGVLGNIFTEGVRKTLTSKEGMESILIGGISGGIQKLRGNIRERGLFGTGGQMGRNTQLAIDSLNKSNLDKVLKDGKKYLGIAIGSQQLRQQAIENDDTFNEKNYEEDYTLSYVMPRVKYGREEAIYQELEGYKQQVMTEGGFEELQGLGYVMPGETKEKFIQRLDNVRRSTEEVKKVYEHVNNKYSGLVDKEGKVVYTPEVIDKMVYAASKVTNLDQRSKELEAKLINNNVDPSRIKEKFAANKEFKEKPEEVLKDGAVVDEIKMTLDTIKASDALESEDIQKDFTDFTEMLVQRQMYINDYFNLRTTPEKFKEEVKRSSIEDTTVPQREPGATPNVIKIKTKAGEQDVEIGEEYYLGRVVEKDKDGNDVYRFPKLTVLGENEDGTIKIKDSSGEVRNVEKDVLLDYKLGRVSFLQADKTASYYLNHINDVFEYNFGKNFGGKRRGRLEYDPEKKKLYFVYKDVKGETKRKEIDNSHFVAKEGFKDARMKIVRKLTKAETREQKQAREDFTSTEELDKQKKSVDETLNQRRQVIKEIKDDTQKKLEDVNKKILAKREKLQNTIEQIDELSTFREKDKYGNFVISFNLNKLISRSVRSLTDLAQLKQNLEREIEELEAYRDELEFNISYLEDFSANLSELPTDSYELYDELDSQIKDLKELSTSTGKQINQLAKLIDSVNATIKDLTEWLESSVKKFDENYPENIKDRIEQIKASKTVSYEDAMALKDALSEYALIEDLRKEISINEKKMADARASMQELYNQLNELGKEQNIREQILKKFDEYLEKYMASQEEEQKVARNEALFSEVLGTMNQSVQNRQYDREYEPDPKKSDRNVVRGTTFPTERSTGGEALAEHHLRANRFGNRMESLPEEKRKNIRGVLLTQKNQSKFIPGLVEFLAGGLAGIGPSTIAMVVVEKGTDGVIRPVDEFGNPIPGKGENETDEAFATRMQNSAVFQVMPENIEGMFRATTTTETKSALIAQYKEWRAQHLNSPTEYAYNIQASFGIPQLVKKTDSQGNTENDYTARVAVEDSGLVSESDLRVKPVIEVPTTQDTITQGSTSFTNALGRVFLRLRNGFVPLRNRKHTSAEAETIFKVLYKLSQNLTKDGKVMGVEESERLISWLRTVVYWGTPKDRATGEFKDPGYNSVWFDKEGGVFKLYMSGKLVEGKPVGIAQFTPSELLNKRGEIISLLSEMYTNTNSFKVQSGWEMPYEQITNISEDGTIESVRWPNYQSYLLSSKSPNKEGKLTVQRNAEDIPLTTSIRPLRDENDVNRNGVYFIINDKANDDKFSSTAPTVAQPVTLTPGAPKPAPQPVAPSVTPTAPAKPAGRFVLDGKTVNSLPMNKPAKATLKFTYNENVPDEIGDLEIVPAEGEKVSLIDALIQTSSLVDKEEINEETGEKVTITAAQQAQDVVAGYVLREVKKEIAAAEEFEKQQQEAAAQQAAPEVAPAPVTPAPVSDVERIEIPRYFTFGELGGAKGKSGKALSSIEADKNDEIAENFKKQLQEGDKLIEPNGTVTYFRNGKVVKSDGSPYGMVDIPAFINGVTIERSKVSVSDKKADIPLGKINNTEYEVKTDGVYYQDKKLDNPKNKTHRQLIEADIKRRTQEEKDNNPTLESLIKVGNTINYNGNKVKISEIRKFGGGGLVIGEGVGVLNIDLKDSDNYILYQNGKKSEQEINAKYDAELKALEGTVSDNAKKARALATATNIQNIIDSKEVSKTIDDFSNTNLDRDGKESLLQDDIKLIVDEWGIDEQSVSDYMKQQGTTLVKAVWRNNKNEFFNILKLWKEGKELKAELADLEAKPAAAPVVTPQAAPTNLEDEMTDEEKRLMDEQSKNTPEDPEYRVVVEKQIKQAEREDWNKVEAFIKKNFPMVPFYRVKNVIQAVGGRKAWGMLKNGAIYVYENAEVGTAYHEIFEAVWKMFTDAKEQASIIKEFKSRTGSFIDRPTGTSVRYSQATPQQIKEQLAEEFRDYVQYSKIPAKPVDGRPFIVKLFADIVSFIKNFFTGSKAKSNTERLFEKISTGYYAKEKVDASALSYAEKGIIDIDEAFASDDAELREIVGFTSDQVHDMMQHLTYMTLVNIATDNRSLFNVMNEPKEELYAKLKSNLQTTVLKDKKAAEDLYARKQITEQEKNERVADSERMWMKVTRKWEEIKARHEEYLRTYGIEFDENDETNVKDESRTGRTEYDGAHKVDNFRKTNSAIKLLLASLPIVDNQGKFMYSKIGGVKLMSLGETYISVMNKVHNAPTVDQKLAILKQMAEEDTNYERLYKRLTKQGSDATVNYDLLDKHDLQLLSAFNTTFSKQNPDVKILNILPSGDIQVGDSNLSSAARQVKENFVNGMKAIFRNPQNRYFERDKKGKALVAKENAVKSVNLGDDALRISFLNSIGIEGFTEDEIRNLELTDPFSAETFRKAVGGIRLSMMERKKIATIGGKILDIEGNLLRLAEIRAKIDNPEFSSTFFGIGGERLQTFIGENPSSAIYNVLASLDNLYQLNTDPRYAQYRYILTDAFAGKNGHSVILNAMFDFQTGRKKSNFDQYMKPAIADGTNNQAKGRKKESSKLTFRERLVQEMNMNLQGFYYNLVAGDASLEYMTYMGNHVSEETLKENYDQVYSMFKGYLIDEIELSRDENRPAVLKGGRKRNDLRFFKTILKSDEKLYNAIIKDDRSGKEIVEDKAYSEDINKAVLAFINDQSKKTKATLSTFGLLTKNEDGTSNISALKIPSAEEITDENLNRHMNAMTINFAIANIEYHKLLYSDPYQYEDELKRIKNFLSPRQSIVSNSPLMNAAYNKIWNEGFNEKGVGYTNFNREYFRTAVYSDVLGTLNLPGYENALYKETDGGGIVVYKAYRNLAIRLGQWNDAEESQYKYEVAWEKRDRSEGLTDEEIKKRGLKLSKEELQILANGNPSVQSAFTPKKPIVSGNKADGNYYNDVVLDKFALYPISYRMAKAIAENGGNSSNNLVKLYDKMQKEDIDYVLFSSSRKVGAKEANPIYNSEDGSFNEAPYKGITNIPFSIVSIQTDVPSKEGDDVSRGTQVTKLVTMDFMEAGVPVDFVDSGKSKEFSAKRYKEWYDIKEESEREKRSPLYKEIKNNENLLREITKEGYNTLLEKFGIQDVDGKYSITDFSKAAKTLRDEMMKREVNDNMIDALDDLEQGKVLIEATPAYQQIRNILYSIADKNVISPKINGGMKVQIPSTFFETNRINSEKINGKDAFTSDVLKFYTNKKGERVCEIMVSRWFGGPMSDTKALEYLNSPEGQKDLLTGIGFRIPSQKQNSIDSFVIKQFLPKEMKDSVVVPAALVQKAGSDFDIDKLSLYLKNTYLDERGRPKLLPFFGIGEAAKQKFSEMYDKGEFITIEQLKELSPEKRQELDRILDEEKDAMTETTSGKLMFDLFGSAIETEIAREFIARGASAEFKRKFVNNLYKRSLQNAYIQSTQNLVSSEENFNRLITPNSADQLKKLAGEISKKTIGTTFDYADPGNMLSRGFMSRLRHAFVTGKYAIGIAAISQTNHSLNQRQPIYIDANRVGLLSEEDFYWLSGGTMNKNDIDIKFGQYNKIEIDGKMVPTLSMIRNAERSEKYPNGQDISDLNGQFIDGYVDIAKGPWIMELGATPNVAGTWLFLVKVGVPIEAVAYFMNQPIIRDYLRSVENAGYSYLFMEDFVTSIKKSSKYNVGEDQLAKVKMIPGTGSLEKMLGETTLSPQQKAEQQFMLNEFLKYAKMAEQLRLVTQGTNYDTANLNDPYLLFKKESDYKKAQNTIISSAADILKNSFVEDIREYANKSRNAIAQILKSDQSIIRNIMERVLAPYTNLSDKEFVTVARKAVSDFFDWVMQNNSDVPKVNFLKRLMLDENSGVKIVKDFKDEIAKDPNHALYNNMIVGKNGLLAAEISDRLGATPDNLMLTNKDNKVYDQNLIIEAFRELREYLKASGKYDIYQNIVGISLLQSGLSTSKISFTSLLPYEDFKKQYNDTLSIMESLGKVRLMDFYDLNVFERNNWNDDDIVPHETAPPAKSNAFGGITYNTKMKFDKGPTKNVQKAIDEGKIPSLLKLNALSRASDSEFVVYSWEVMDASILTNEEVEAGMTVKRKKMLMKSEGDFSFINKGLFKKVYYTDGSPVTTSFTTDDGKIITSFVYKMINAWGDSFRAKELYSLAVPSKIDNGFVKVEDKEYLLEHIDNRKKYGVRRRSSSEKSDEVVASYFPRGVQKTPTAVKAAPEVTAPTQPAVSLDQLTEFTPERKQEILSNFAAKHKMTEQQAKDYINNAIAKTGKNAVVTQLNKTDEQGNKCY